MAQQEQIQVTTRDRLLRGWENSMELVRDFEMYSKEIGDDPEAVSTFKAFAEEEGAHAAAFRKLLLRQQTEQHHR